MTEPYRIDLFINNSDVPGESYFELNDPGRLNEVVARVATASATQANDAVLAANDAFQVWRKTDVRERIERLIAAADALAQSAPELSVLLVREQGMLLKDTQRDVAGGIWVLRNTAEIAESFLRPEQYEDAESWISIEKVPRGVVAAIVPWNAPIGLTMSKVAPALVTGNTVVVKPSPFAPATVTRALKIIAAFFPSGAINVVHGEGEAGPTLSRHPLVTKIAFTGGTSTGKLIMADAATTVKNISLELGGNDPAIALDDVNPVDVISKLVPSIFLRSGQVCYAIKRAFL
jgi:acyl-CoA reductase-like NAD-dependent aldehyde dehydrogenase